MMKLFSLALFFFIGSVSYVFGQTTDIEAKTISDSIIISIPGAEKKLPPRIRPVHYTIKATLNTEEKSVTADLILSWQNYSADTIRKIPLHLFMNAFKNSKSSFMREKFKSGGEMPWQDTKHINWGYIQINSATLKNGESVTSRIKYVQPDDDNTDDQTVAEITLPKPLLPKDSLVLNIKFEVQLPEVVARAGYAKDFFMVAQWFPKIGVYEPAGWRGATKGSWNCHQYHAESEFYANFGSYDVQITLPKEYIVGASGQFISKADKQNNTTTHYFRGDSIIDFAWTASPKFLETVEYWKHVKIRLLLQPEHKKNRTIFIETAKKTLEYLEAHLGKYPYQTLTLVDPTKAATNAAGMEYPNLVVLDSPSKSASVLRMTELVTIHEIVHQYFMLLMASNETEDAWLDEGFTQYWENKIMDSIYGSSASVINYAGIKFSDTQLSRFIYVMYPAKQAAPATTLSWKFPLQSCGVLTYHKTATMLHTLENMLGEEQMETIWKKYYDTWSFRHPNASSFVQTVNQVVSTSKKPKYGYNLHWFFNTYLFGSQVCDYEVIKIYNQERLPELGFFDKNGSLEEISDPQPQTADQTYWSRVDLRKNGTASFPVTVLCTFADGSTETKEWTGKENSITYWFDNKTTKLVSVEIDPEQINTMDINTINNSYTLEPDLSPFWKYALKLTFWFQNIIESFALFV